MKRRKKGKNKILYALLALAAVVAAGFIGVRFGLSQGSMRRARMAEEASETEAVSSGITSLENGADDGSGDGASGAESGATSGESSGETVSGADSAETDPEEEERTHAMLAEMSEAATKEDEIRFREVIRAGVPDVPAYAAAEAEKAAKKKTKKKKKS